MTDGDTAASCGYDWSEDAGRTRLTRRGPLPRRGPPGAYLAFAVALGAVYAGACLSGSPPAVVLGTFVAVPAITFLSLAAVDRRGDRRRRPVAGDVLLGAPPKESGDRSAGEPGVTVEGRDAGPATAVTVVRWGHREPGYHGGSNVSVRHELSIVTARGVFVLCEQPDAEPVLAFAKRLVRAIGHGVAFVDREAHAPGPAWGLWAIPFILAFAQLLPMPSDRRRVVIASAFVVAVVSMSVATSLGIRSRSRRALRELYGLRVEQGSAAGAGVAWAIAVLAFALLVLSVVGPGGPFTNP